MADVVIVAAQLHLRDGKKIVFDFAMVVFFPFPYQEENILYAF